MFVRQCCRALYLGKFFFRFPLLVEAFPVAKTPSKGLTFDLIGLAFSHYLGVEILSSFALFAFVLVYNIYLSQGDTQNSLCYYESI